MGDKKPAQMGLFEGEEKPAVPKDQQPATPDAPESLANEGTSEPDSEQIYDVNEGAWIQSEIYQIAHRLESFHDAQIWLLDNDFILPKGWDGNTFKGTDDEWRMEFIHHLFNSVERRHKIMSLLEDGDYDVDSIISKSEEFDADDYMESLERERAEFFTQRLEEALQETLNEARTRGIVTMNQVRLWVKRNEIKAPSWLGSDRGNTERMFEGFLSPQILETGKLIIVEETSESQLEPEQGESKETRLVLRKNPDKQKWDSVISTTVSTLGSKKVAELWMSERGLKLSEKWDNPRAKWDTQMRYQLIYFLQRGDLEIVENEEGINLLQLSDEVV